ncbi:MAG: peptidoglycan-binding protein [Rhodobacterales bacterium 32-67-9]|nr:MAG: peptidoglycan-binding protein [Rhodobacterales bacterium 32-67-9]
MQTVADIAREIVAREGGYVNDPDDPGGATKYGVTIGTMRRLGLDLTGDGEQAPVFDMYVNAGSNAVRILQRLLNEMGHDLAVDGVLGPVTVAAAHRAAGTAPVLVADAYGIARRNYYYALADVRPASRKYARRRDGGKGGWITRAEAFLSPRFHLSEAEHRARTAAWV